jgi:hypothetical protein
MEQAQMLLNLSQVGLPLFSSFTQNDIVLDDADKAEEMKEAPLPTPSMPTLESPPVVASESHLISDTTSQSSHTSSRSPPTSMPIPAAPRRAGPPRKKSARNLKPEAIVQDPEPPKVPSVPAEAEEVTETPSSPSVTQQSPPAVNQEAEPEQDLSQQLNVTNSHEIVFDHPSAPSPPEDHLTTSDLVASIDDDELVRRDPEFSQEPDHQESRDALADITEESQMDDTQTPRLELETDAPTITIPIAQDTENVAETHDFEELPSSLVHEPEPHTPSTSDRSVYVERLVDTPMFPSAHSSEPSPAIGTIISTAAVPTHDPPEVAAEGIEDGTSENHGESEPNAAMTEDQTDDEEADRRRRIAERLAKMGGRNPLSASPFSATVPPRKVSGDKPYEAVNISHEESTVDEHNYNGRSS